MNQKTLNISIVAPCFEDFECVNSIVRELADVQMNINHGNSNIKILIVNDSPWIIPKQKPQSPDHIQISCLQLPFNVGHQTAIACGIK